MFARMAMRFRNKGGDGSESQQAKNCHGALDTHVRHLMGFSLRMGLQQGTKGRWWGESENTNGLERNHG